MPKLLSHTYKGLSTYTVPPSISLDSCHWLPTLGVSENYLLEHADSLHRNRDYLWDNYNHWRRTYNSKTERYNDLPDFFKWLDKGKDTIGVEKGRIEYFSDEKRKQHQITFDKDGVIRTADGNVASTMSFKGKKPQYAAYVVDEDGNFFICEHKKNKIQHTSFLAGKRVLCAGMIQIDDGKIVDINNRSGHYKSQQRNLYEAAKLIPPSAFAPTGKITFSKPYFSEGFLNSLASFHSNYKWIDNTIGSLVRKIGRGLQSKGSTTKESRDEFIKSSEKALSDNKEHPLLIRDKKGNRVAVTLQETLLAKAIVENPSSWSPTVNKINNKIIDIVEANIGNKKVQEKIEKYLKNIPEEIKGKGNTLDQFKAFMQKNPDPSQTILFHKDFFEDIYPLTLKPEAKKGLDEQVEAMRHEQFFSKEARGRKTVRSQNYMPKTSYRMGITNSDYTPVELQEYYKGKQGTHNPGCSYFKFKGTRATVEDAQIARGSYDPNLSYSQQVAKYDIPFIAGPSGTASKILTPLLFDLDLDLSPEERQEYLMALSGTLVANGHHSFYEVMVVGNLFGMQNRYDTNFYTDRVMTDAFKASPGFTQYQFELGKIKEQFFRQSQTEYNSSSKMMNFMNLKLMAKELANHRELITDLRLLDPNNSHDQLKKLVNSHLIQLSPDQVFKLFTEKDLGKKLGPEQFLLTLYDAKYPQLAKVEKLVIDHVTKLADQPKMQSVVSAISEKIEETEKTGKIAKVEKTETDEIVPDELPGFQRSNTF